MIDIIFVSNAKNPELIEVTQNAINSAIATTKYKLNIVVLEQTNYVFNNCKTVNYTFKFNYNRCLNYGISITKGKYILLANNDLIFYDNWAEILIEAMGSEYLSASPFSEYNPHNPTYLEDITEGYRIGYELLGWAIFVKRKIFNKIGKLDESYKFWASDRAYAEQLRLNDVKHIIVKNSHVEHRCSLTLNQSENKTTLMHPEHLKFQNDLKYEKYFSIIMPSYLEDYPRGATNRIEKFERAIESIINQTFDNWELLIVSDGCTKTIETYQQYFDDERIKLFYIDKQPMWSGNVRNAVFQFRKGRYTCYCDSDDYFEKNHLQLIKDNISDYDWGIMNEYALTNEGKKIRNVKLKLSSSGTSSIVHRTSMLSDWSDCNGTCHDWAFIQKLITESTSYGHIGQCGYVVCHTPSSFDN